MKKEWLIAIGALVFIAVVVFFLPKQQIQVPSTETAPGTSEAESVLANATAVQPTTTTSTTSGWKDAELKDVRTGSKFKISDFYSKPILVESFAVWCPKCKAQQDEFKKLKSELGDSVIFISLDTDANEDESKVLDHINRYSYDWYYAVSPTAITQDLIKEYGVGIINAPSTPVILICPKLQTSKLPSGIKDVAELKAELAKC